MGLKICEACDEEVDEAKAFCPGCGSPFVQEEKREGTSEFDDYAGTMNFSKSTYKMMLTEMELDTSKPPEIEQSQKIEPIQSKSKTVKQPKVSTTKDDSIVEEKKADKNKWFIVALGVGILLLLFVLATLIVALYFFIS